VKEFEAESLRKKADEIDPAVLKEHREITTSASKASKKRAAKKFSRNPKRKMAKKAGKAKRGRPPGSKPQEPSQAQVAKVLKKGRGQSVGQIAARNGWTARLVSNRLQALARAGAVKNVGQGRDGRWVQA